MMQPRIALLSDNANIASMQTAILLGCGFRDLNRIARISEFSDAVRQESFDLFIVNHLGEINPVEAVQIIREDGVSRSPHAVSLLTTSKATRKSIRGAIDVGYDDIIVLPFSARTMALKLNQLIERERCFVRTVDYFGPDRRRVDEDLPIGMKDRRMRNLVAEEKAKRDNSKTANSA